MPFGRRVVRGDLGLCGKSQFATKPPQEAQKGSGRKGSKAQRLSDVMPTRVCPFLTSVC